MDLDLEWDLPLRHRRGASERLCGIDVFFDFEWLEEFPDERAQFRNGMCLAAFVRKNTPSGKTPALLLTVRPEPKQGFRHTDTFCVFVVNLREYRATAENAALSYLAAHLDVDITDVDRLQKLASTADPLVLGSFIEYHREAELVVRWAESNAERLVNLRTSLGVAPSEPASLADAIQAVGALDDLPDEDVQLIAELLASANKERRVEILRAITSDTNGREATSEVLAERTAQRIEDARSAVSAYRALLEDSGSTETAMQKFIEENIWLLGLDYAAMRPRPPGPSGATDFLLERFDGFSDLLELKSPHDEIIKAPAETESGVPPPHKYSLSATLAQAIAQAVVYRDRLTRYAEASKELYGLRHTRDPRLIIVLGTAAELPQHRKSVLIELNKSLHRIEIVPYDVLADRAEARLDNVDEYLLADAG